MIRRVKGTQDFLDLTLFNFIIDKLSHHVALYHFSPIATPIIEHLELFKRSLGEQTDAVSKEMFIIAKRGEATQEDEICLRPEITASIARAFVENGIQTTPWKVFTWGPCFRYERPQKGRYRQFHQVSVEVIGSAATSQDAELIMMFDRFFHEVLHINSYALQINFLGCPSDRAIFKTKLLTFLTTIASSLCAACLERKDKNIMRIFDCKNESCQQLYNDAPHIVDSLCASCNQEWKQLQLQLQLLAVSYVCKPTLVRGLDYYNKTVFEFVSNQLGAQNTFCGGGRYDQLVKELGASQDQPSIGAALGIERLMLMLEPYKEKLPIAQKPALHIIIPMGNAEQTLALILADTLRAAQLCVEILLEGDSMKSMMRKAHKGGATYAIILGSDELATKTVTVKNMVTGQEAKMPQIELAAWLKK
jgi:histidyl-tRNA synthetase